jgi:hypothetical protein
MYRRHLFVRNLNSSAHYIRQVTIIGRINSAYGFVGHERRRGVGGVGDGGAVEQRPAERCVRHRRRVAAVAAHSPFVLVNGRPKRQWRAGVQMR